MPLPDIPLPHPGTGGVGEGAIVAVGRVGDGDGASVGNNGIVGVVVAGAVDGDGEIGTGVGGIGNWSLFDPALFETPMATDTTITAKAKPTNAQIKFCLRKYGTGVGWDLPLTLNDSPDTDDALRLVVISLSARSPPILCAPVVLLSLNRPASQSPS